MKIYFAGAIRGGRKDAKIYKDIIEYLAGKGHVLTEHVGDLDLKRTGEIFNKDEEIYNRDMQWLQSSDVIVAEVSIPSLGVGYELGIAEKLKIPVLCLYRKKNGNNLSAMLNGNNQFSCKIYHSINEARSYIDIFFQSLNS